MRKGDVRANLTVTFFHILANFMSLIQEVNVDFRCWSHPQELVEIDVKTRGVCIRGQDGRQQLWVSLQA
jgi:hypothetical protein